MDATSFRRLTTTSRAAATRIPRGCCRTTCRRCGWAAPTLPAWSRLRTDPASCARTSTALPFNILQETQYPFDDEVRMTVEAAAPVRLTLWLRRPAWASAFHVDGIESVERDGWIVIARSVARTACPSRCDSRRRCGSKRIRPVKSRCCVGRCSSCSRSRITRESWPVEARAGLAGRRTARRRSRVRWKRCRSSIPPRRTWASCPNLLRRTPPDRPWHESPLRLRVTASRWCRWAARRCGGPTSVRVLAAGVKA